MPLLPPDVVVMLAGEPVVEGAAARELHDLTSRHGDRVRVTGYLPEPELETYLAATDLAVCPFVDMSGSGSLSTWISAGRPILASDLPQIAEYNEVAPGAISTFAPYTPTALASRVSELLQADAGERTQAVARLADVLKIPRMFERHVDVYSACSGHREEASRRLVAHLSTLVTPSGEAVR